MKNFVYKLNLKITELKIKKFLKNYEVFEEFKKLPKVEFKKEGDN